MVTRLRRLEGPLGGRLNDVDYSSIAELVGNTDAAEGEDLDYKREHVPDYDDEACGRPWPHCPIPTTACERRGGHRRVAPASRCTRWDGGPFRDLFAAVLREVWGQSVQAFADSNDGGRTARSTAPGSHRAEPSGVLLARSAPVQPLVIGHALSQSGGTIEPDTASAVTPPTVAGQTPP